MRTACVLLSLVLAGLICGCSMYELAFRNMVEAPIDQCNRKIDQWRDCERARVAWVHFKDAHPTEAFSHDFADGFKQGFEEWIWEDKSPDPPYLPPWKYRHPKYESPEGFRVIEDWYHGWQAGVAAAQSTGYREYRILPTAPTLLGAGDAAACGGVAESEPPRLEAPAPAPPPPPVMPQAQTAAPRRSSSPNQATAPFSESNVRQTGGWSP